MSNYLITITGREVNIREIMEGGVDQPECSELSFQTDDREAAMAVATRWLPEVKPREYPLVTHGPAPGIKDQETTS